MKKVVLYDVDNALSFLMPEQREVEDQLFLQEANEQIVQDQKKQQEKAQFLKVVQETFSKHHLNGDIVILFSSKRKQEEIKNSLTDNIGPYDEILGQKEIEKLPGANELSYTKLKLNKIQKVRAENKLSEAVIVAGDYISNEMRREYDLTHILVKDINISEMSPSFLKLAVCDPRHYRQHIAQTVQKINENEVLDSSSFRKLNETYDNALKKVSSRGEFKKEVNEYHKKRSNDEKEFKSSVSRLFSGNERSRTQKLIAAEEIMEQLDDGTFNSKEVHFAAKNGEEAKLVKKYGPKI